VRSERKKHNTDAGESPLKLLKQWSDSEHFEANSDDEMRTVAKEAKPKKRRLPGLVRCLQLYSCTVLMWQTIR